MPVDPVHPHSDARQDLTVHDDEPGVVAISPLPPRLGHRLQVGPVRQPQLDGPRTEGGQAPLRAGLRLPGPVGGRGVVTSVKPAARAQDSSRLPASGSPPLARAVAM